MSDWLDEKNPFADFGEEEPEVEESLAEDEPEEPIVVAEGTSGNLYDVELAGVWQRFPISRNCVISITGDVFFFESVKKSLHHTREEIKQLSDTRKDSPFSYRHPNLLIQFLTVFAMQIRLHDRSDLILQVAKLIAWSKTTSNDEMEPVVRQEITRLSWRSVWVYAWIPVAVAFGFASTAVMVRGWIAAFGPMHGLALVFSGWVIAMFWKNTHGAVALPTGCFSCALDYAVKSFFTVDPDGVFAYRLFAVLMAVFGGLCLMPFRYNAMNQQEFTSQLELERSIKQDHDALASDDSGGDAEALCG